MKNTTAARLTSVVLISALLIGLSAMSLRAMAQTSPADDGPVASANQIESAAENHAAASDVQWTVSDLVFQSNYPNGFSFSAHINSSAGKIATGRVIWSHAPGTQRSRSFEVDAQTGILSASWQPGPGESTPPWVGVTYLWDVTDEAGNTFQTEPQSTEYADTGREWLRTESEDVIVFSEGLPAEVNDLTVEAMAAQRETFRAAWGGLLPYKPRAILFGDRAVWDEWQIGLNNTRVIGTTRPEWGATVQITSRGAVQDMAYNTVPHEVAHLYQDEVAGLATVSWFIEGNATFFQLEEPVYYENMVRELAASGNLPPLLQGTGPGVRGPYTHEGYAIGYTFWKWWVENYGLEGHYQLMKLVGSGITRTQAIQQVSGLTLEEVESRWRVWLGASPVPPTLIPTPTFFFLPSPTPWS
ncbi:MAG: hypothetical protein HY866_15930 [Chloroflexi bacterium]|nr:hypothetical protein [Chloroflexota bacterium]